MRACEPVSFWLGNVIATVILSTQGFSKNILVMETRLAQFKRRTFCVLDS